MSNDNEKSQTNKGDFGGLTEDEFKILQSLQDPDATTKPASPINSNKLDHLVLSWIVQHPDGIKFCIETGLKPTAFAFEAHQILYRNALAEFKKHGSLPSQAFLLALCQESLEGKQPGIIHSYLEICQTAFDPLSPQDLVAIKSRAQQKAKASAMQHALLDASRALAENKLDFAKHINKVSQIQKIGEKEKVVRRAYKPKDFYQLPKAEWLIDRHFRKKSTVCVYGGSGEGKTFFAMDTALCMATGKPFLDKWHISQDNYEFVGHPVCYVTSEGEHDFALRMQVWEIKHGISAPDNFIIIPNVFNLQEATEVDEILRMATEQLGQMPSIIYIDTLARNFGGGDENSSKDMNNFIRQLDYMREQSGATIAVVHHTGHSEKDRERGSSALRAACDTSIRISMAGQGLTAKISVNCSKQKSASPFKAYSLVPAVIPIDEHESSLVWRLKTEEEEKKEIEQEEEAESLEKKILHRLPELAQSDARPDNTYTVSKMAEELKKDRGEVNSVMKELATRTGSGVGRVKFKPGATEPYYYFRAWHLSLRA